MQNLGEIIRKLREGQKLPLRSVAAYLDIDQAILSKIERGQRKANRELVLKLATFFNVNENDLLVAWLSDKLVYEIGEEELALKALQVAEQKMSYPTSTKMNVTNLIKTIKSILQKDGRVANAWIFGSILNNNVKQESDVDLMIEFNDKKKYSMFDILDIAFVIENEIDRKVDVVEKGQLNDFALKTAKNRLKKIYG